jgi:Ca2+-binding RTX toxin-like protein
MAGVESVGIFAGAGGDGDVIDGRGGPEFVAALPLPLSVAGSEGDDDLSAGTVGSIIAGNGGNDTLRGGPGNDTLRGNGGRDTLAYDGAPGGVTVNLTAGPPQNTGGAGFDTLDREGGSSPDIEDLVGSPFADILIGSDTANLIVGGDGVDTIAALDGADDVRVDDGVEGDSADCGPGADSATVDALGTAPLDRATDCEALALTDRTPPAQPQTPGPTPQPSGDSTGAGSANGRANVNSGTAPDLTPPTLRLSLKKKQRVGTLTVRVTCLDEACTVRGAGALRVAGAAKKRRLSARPLRLAKGATGTLRFKPTRPTRQAARLALRRGRRVSAAITVRASDAAGNTGTQRRALKLR